MFKNLLDFNFMTWTSASPFPIPNSLFLKYLPSISTYPKQLLNNHPSGILVFTPTPLSAILPWPHAEALCMRVLARTQEDTLAPFMEIRDLDSLTIESYWKTLFSIWASPTAITKIISHFQPFDLIIHIHWALHWLFEVFFFVCLFVLSFLMFHTDLIPSTRLSKPGILFSFLSFLYSIQFPLFSFSTSTLSTRLFHLKEIYPNQCKTKGTERKEQSKLNAKNS